MIATKITNIVIYKLITKYNVFLYYNES